MSAISAHTNTAAVKSGMSPFKPAADNRRTVQSTSKKNQNFLGDEDLNDRMDFNGSFKDSNAASFKKMPQ